MKKQFILSCFIMIFVLILTGCQTTPGTEDPIEPSVPPVVTEISITAVEENVTMKDNDVATFDFTSLFTITKDGNNVEVLAEYITHDVKQTPGVYEVTCSYEGKKVVKNVEVLETIYSVTLEVESITLNLNTIQDYDFISLFKAYVDDIQIRITSDMVETNVKSSAGTYYYKVTNKSASKTLNIIVENVHEINVVNSYQMLNIHLSDLETLDFKSLFTIYVDGVFTDVLDEYITGFDKTKVFVNTNYLVSLNYTLDGQTVTSATTVRVIPDEEVLINALNIETYPNAEVIDLKSLFTIKVGNKEVEVKDEYISGSIDYTKEGDNEITLTYLGHQATSIVKVVRGVVINYRFGDVITIIEGTNQDKYNFANDFIVIVNGINFPNLPVFAIDTSNVDFSKEGRYTAKLTIAYNNKPLGLSSVNFTYYEKEITYVVTKTSYDLTIKSDKVYFPFGTTNINLFSNLNLVINGKKQSFTTNPEYVDVITTYIEVLNQPSSFEIGEHLIELNVHIKGLEQPVYICYTLVIESSLRVEVVEKSIFAHDTLYTKDLFKVYDKDVLIETPQEAITGKVDCNKPGVYYVYFNYLGIYAQSKVIVYDNVMKGTFKTLIKTIEYAEEEDEDYSEGDWGMMSTSSTMATPQLLGDLRITNSGEIIFRGQKATILRGIDESTLEIKVGANIYMMYYQNGIIMLDPNNDIKLGFTDDRRPLIYFNEQLYDLNVRFIVNYGANYVLAESYTSYSIDVIKYTVKETNEVKYFGMKVYLYNKTSSDTEYEVSFGEVTFSENFQNIVDNESVLYFNGDEYNIIMLTRTNAKVKQPVKDKVYANKQFTGTIDNLPAKLIFSEYQGARLLIDSKEIFNLSGMEVDNLKYGGIDASNNTVKFNVTTKEVTASYKFILNVNNNTFTYVEKDNYFGKFETDSMYVFLDGYGEGHVNFNTNSYYTTVIKYEIFGNTVRIKYQDTRQNFAYGTYASLYVDSLMNILTLKEADSQIFSGKKLVNKKITNGAIVDIDTILIGANADAVAKKQFLDAINIQTKDGMLTYEQKLKCVDVSRIKFSVPGFYQYTITLNVNGENVIGYYAVQVLAPTYENHALKANYGGGVIYKDHIFEIDKYGMGSIEANNKRYVGMMTINPDKSFSFKGQAPDGTVIYVTGSELASGILNVRSTGDIAFNDYYVLGTILETGTNGFILREFTIKGQKIYMKSTTPTDLGTFVDVEIIEGNTFTANAILKVTNGDEVTFLKINSLGNLTKGLTQSDAYRGTYTSEGNPSIFLDGFGKAIYNEFVGTYKASGRVITIEYNGEVIIVNLNTTNNTYESSSIVLDNTLLEGKFFTASYIFMSSNYPYTAQTSISFEKGGKVVITSKSDEYENAENAYSTNKYEPPFIGNGTYSVKGLNVTIVVNGYTFVFRIEDVSSTDSLVLISSNVDENAHGFISVNTKFIKK